MDLITKIDENSLIIAHHYSSDGNLKELSNIIKNEMIDLSKMDNKLRKSIMSSDVSLDEVVRFIYEA